MAFSTLLTEVTRPPSHTRTSMTTRRHPSSEAPITAFQKTRSILLPPSSLLPPPADTGQPHRNLHSINSRMPSLRYGKGHIFNNFFDSILDGVNARDGAQLLVENDAFENSKKALYSTAGYAVARGNDFGDSSNTALQGTFSSTPYIYSLTETCDTKAHVMGNAGNILSFGLYYWLLVVRASSAWVGLGRTVEYVRAYFPLLSPFPAAAVEEVSGGFWRHIGFGI